MAEFLRKPSAYERRIDYPDEGNPPQPKREPRYSALEEKLLLLLDEQIQRLAREGLAGSGTFVG